MKKVSRIVSVLIVLGICLSLCGCDALDELRASRASFTASGVMKLSDGTEYIRLPECKELNPNFTGYESVYVVEEEIPLLLTTIFGNYFPKSDDGVFLQAYTEEGVIYYCRADAYDSILARIKNGFTAEVYCYTYYDYENDEEFLYTLTKAQADAVMQVCTTQEPETLPEAAMLDYDYMADLYFCTADRLFRENTVDICVIKGKYYVVDYGDVTTLYSVPVELTDTFAGIMEKQVESDSYWEDWEE